MEEVIMENNNGSQNHIIQLIYNPKEEDKHVAKPGHQEVNIDDTIQFETRNTRVLIYFPNSSDLFVNFVNDCPVLEVPANQLSDKFKIQDPESSQSEFPYAVYCENGNDFAVGGTTPLIIIRR